MAENTAVETLVTMMTQPTTDELREWWNEATKKYAFSKKMAEIEMAPYDPQAERILRLIVALSGAQPPPSEKETKHG